MTYSEPLINQISHFLSSVGFGFVMCIYYMAVRLFFRILSRKKWALMTGDAFFSVTGSFVSFFFMIIDNNGQVRFNLIIGQLIGALALYFTLGRYLMKPLMKMCDGINSVLSSLFYPVRVYFKALKNTLIGFLKFLKGILIKNKLKKDKKKTNYCENTLEISE